MVAKAWGERENLTLSRAELDNCRPTGAGPVVRAFCPFHGSDKQRSLRVDLETGHFKCFSCEAWGYLEEARERIGDAGAARRSPPMPAPKRPTKPAQPEPEARPELEATLAAYRAALPGSPGETYLRGRGIGLELAQAAGIGYAAPGQWLGRDWQGGRIVFAHTNPSGKLVSLYGRAAGDVPKTLKHDHLPGTKGYFNAQTLATGSGPVTICEGAFDALALMAAGAPRVVAIFGVTGWRWDWARDVRELIFALDVDEAGSQKLRELAREAVHRGRRVAYVEPSAYGGEKDASAAWAAGVLDVGELSGIFGAEVPQEPVEAPEAPAMEDRPPAGSPFAPGAPDEPVRRCPCGFELKTGQTEESRTDQILHMIPVAIIDEIRLQRGAWLELEMRKHNATLADAIWGASITDNPMET